MAWGQSSHSEEVGRLEFPLRRPRWQVVSQGKKQLLTVFCGCLGKHTGLDAIWVSLDPGASVGDTPRDKEELTLLHGLDNNEEIGPLNYLCAHNHSQAWAKRKIYPTAPMFMSVYPGFLGGLDGERIYLQCRRLGLILRGPISTHVHAAPQLTRVLEIEKWEKKKVQHCINARTRDVAGQGTRSLCLN